MYTFKLIDGDIAVRGDGNVVEVTGKDRIVQELRCWLLEPLGTDTLYNAFGSDLDTMVGSPMLEEEMAQVQIEVGRVVANYWEYQKRQVEEDMAKGDDTLLRNWGAGDVIASVDSIELSAVATTLEVTVKLTTADGAQLVVTQTS